MKRFFLLMGILFFVTNPSFATDLKRDRKQVYELRKECGTSAVEFAKRVKLCNGNSGYINHYNMKLNICFIDISASCDSEKGSSETFWSESVIDVNENKDYANYIGPGKIVDDKPVMCFAGAKQCKSLPEFQELMKPYMND
jgi:hypothetical protein